MPTKVHIRGLDELTTKEIEAFAAEYFPEQTPKVEWVDDTSANLVYTDATTSAKALQALTVSFNGSMPHDLQLRNAKTFSVKPTIELQIRLATLKDRKAPRAHERSRFYMMYPEHDPREQARGDPEYKKRKYPRRRRSIENNRFDASMYDDDAHSTSSHSYTSDHRNGQSRNRKSRRDRDRSASPSRTRDNYRRREDSPPHGPRAENKGKELFPSGPKTVILANNANKELFPQRKSGATALHRRNDSIDATHDHTTDVLSSSLSKTMSVPFIDDTSNNNTSSKTRSSFPLRSDNLKGDDGAGFSIKGTAGFSIRGAANANTEARVKELFPTKVNNKGKELFASRIRKQAEEFY